MEKKLGQICKKSTNAKQVKVKTILQTKKAKRLVSGGKQIVQIGNKLSPRQTKSNNKKGGKASRRAEVATIQNLNVLQNSLRKATSLLEETNLKGQEQFSPPLDQCFSIQQIVLFCNLFFSVCFICCSAHFVFANFNTSHFAGEIF